MTIWIDADEYIAEQAAAQDLVITADIHRQRFASSLDRVLTRLVREAR